MVLPAQTRSTWRGTLAGPPPRPHVRRSSLGTLPVLGWQSCWIVWSTGKRAVLWVAGKASVSLDTTPGIL